VSPKLTPKLSPKIAAKRKAADSDDDDSDEAPPPPKKKIDVDGSKSSGGKGGSKGGDDDDLTVFVGGIPFSADEATFRKDFGECGEIERLSMPMNDEGRPKGIAFITYKTKAGVEAACKFNGDDYGGRTLTVNLASDKSQMGKGKGEKGKGKGKGNQELTVFVRGLPFSVDESALRKDFEECGEIESLRMPLNEEGKPKGIAFIEYKTEEGLKKALDFNETDYGGRTIGVAKAGEGGKGKDGKGKDGKGKDKGKGKKGKSKGKGESMASAKQHGGMVESTGTKQTFADSDDE